MSVIYSLYPETSEEHIFCSYITRFKQLLQESSNPENFIAEELNHETDLSNLFLIKKHACLAQASLYYSSNTSLSIEIMRNMNYLIQKDPLSITSSLSSKYCHSLFDLANYIDYKENSKVAMLSKSIYNKGMIWGIDCIENIDAEYSSEISRDYIYIIPPKTGYFSYLEYLCLQVFIASLYTKRIVVNTKNWLYGLDLKKYFNPPIESVEVLFDVNDNIKTSDNTISRNACIQLLETNSTLRVQYRNWKSRFFNEINNIHSRSLTLSNLSLHLHHKVLFLRMGDKVHRESLQPSKKIIFDLLSQEGGYAILSDSSGFLLELSQCNIAHNNLIISNINELKDGFIFENESFNINSLNDIMMKFYLLVGCNHLSGCPSSNIVNAAISAKSRDLKKDQKINLFNLFTGTLT